MTITKSAWLNLSSFQWRPTMPISELHLQHWNAPDPFLKVILYPPSKSLINSKPLFWLSFMGVLCQKFNSKHHWKIKLNSSRYITQHLNDFTFLFFSRSFVKQTPPAGLCLSSMLCLNQTSSNTAEDLCWLRNAQWWCSVSA